MRRVAGEVALAARVRRLEVSPTVAMAQRAAALKARGVKVLDFTVGEPDQPTPARILAAGREAMEAGHTKYAPAAGIPELRAAVVQRYREDFGATFAPGQVTVTVGGKQALALVYQALLDRGSEVVIPTPAWPTFAEAARVAGGRPVFVPLREEDGFRVTARAVTRKVSPRTRAIVLNSPCNPTGAVVATDELVALARLARRRGIALLYDDTYAHLIFREGEPPKLGPVQQAAGDSLVILGTVSKTYCMTGWRVGWVIGPLALAAACAALNSHSVQGPATFAQRAAAEALLGPQDVARELAAEYRRRRAFVHPAVARIPGIVCPQPEGAFYLFPNVRGCLSPRLPDAITLATRLLDEKAVAVVPGEGFSAPGHFRMSFAASADDLREGVERLSDFFARVASDGGRSR
jgi:aspartate aminotransferase